jgi:hypothetical protein
MGDLFEPRGKGADHLCRWAWIDKVGGAVRLVAKHRDCPSHAGVLGIPFVADEEKSGTDEPAAG